MAVWIDDAAKTFTLTGGKISYVMKVDEDARLLHLHWGPAVPSGALRFCPEAWRPVASFDLPLSVLPLELPTWGQGWYGEPALAVQSPAGDEITDLRVTGWETVPGKPALPGLPAVYTEADAEAETLRVFLRDALTGVEAEALYTVFSASGAIARSLKIVNRGNAPVEITRLLAASVPFWEGDFEALHLRGAWARERSIVRAPMGQGVYRIASQRGASGHEENPFLALCRKETTEFSGEVWGMSLVYSGSFQALGALDHSNHTRLSIGMNPDVFSWRLQPGESISSPEAVLVYSGEGLNGLSQIYHRLYRTRLARGIWRDRERPVLVNNWEGTYFDFDENRLLAIAEKAKELGIELFVLDDGWFGKRNNDNCSLGDWVENREKLPGGLRGLGEKLNAMGLRFGLWFEPEMVSPDSDLYRAHPDWCLHAQGRPRTEARQQLILDCSREDVQQYIIDSISRVLSSAPIGYVKWDMNRNMTEGYSPLLPADRQKETQHRYMLGLYRVLETITSAFPQILFESCSGGGGRFDPGMLYYMPQTWTSDDTDALERMKIQYGTSLVYPASAMGAHVSAVPNHQTGRITPLSLRCQVALGGNFGFELDLAKMTEDELTVARQAVEQVKRYRGLTETGTFWRLCSPFEGRHTAWAFVSEDQRESLLCVYQGLCVPNTPPLHLRMKGLNPELTYLLDEGDRCSGAALMVQGVFLPLRGDFSGQVIHLVAE